MPDYEMSGTENLRADAKAFDGTEKDSPTMSGTPVGGTENMRADHKVIVGSAKDTVPTQQSVDIPPGVQHFDDDMGRNQMPTSYDPPKRKGLTGEDLMYGKARSEMDSAIKRRDTVRETLGLREGPRKNKLTSTDLDAANAEVDSADKNWRYYQGRK